MAKTITQEQIRQIQVLLNEHDNKAARDWEIYCQNKKQNRVYKGLYEHEAFQAIAIKTVMKILGFDYKVNSDTEDYLENKQVWMFVETD